jgi:hypothetical protein
LDPSEAIGQGIGRVLIPVVLFLWGMHRCQALAEQPNVNANGARGLMFSLGGWVLLLLQSAFTPMLAWPLTFVALAGVLLLCGIGAVRSIQGLAHWNEFTHGNTHAVFGVLIGVGLSVLILYGFVRGFTRS